MNGFFHLNHWRTITEVLTLIWQTVGVIVIGTLLLRIAGRKSISQMTMAQVIVMIGLGTLIIQPITGNG